ncbi:MAG: RHS repeat domain-containing protein, partial [Bacteroidia bacterium]
MFAETHTNSIIGRRRHYHTFGMQMPGRTWYGNADQYRYGYNDKEKDRDLSSGASDFGMREYDDRIGRFTSLDPFKCLVPNKSPFVFAGNSPLLFIDQAGGFMIDATTGGTLKQRAKLEKTLRAIHQLANRNKSLTNPIIKEFIDQAGLPADQSGVDAALRILSYGSGPVVVITKEKKLGSWGRYTSGDNFVRINNKLLDDDGSKAGNEDYVGDDYNLDT